jgi:hypothetical protein
MNSLNPLGINKIITSMAYSKAVLNVKADININRYHLPQYYSKEFHYPSTSEGMRRGFCAFASNALFKSGGKR